MIVWNAQGLYTIKRDRAIDRIADAMRDFSISGHFAKHIVISSKTWWQVASEVSSPYQLSPDDGNVFQIYGAEVHIAPVDDEIFLA